MPLKQVTILNKINHIQHGLQLRHTHDQDYRVGLIYGYDYMMLALAIDRKS